MKNLVLLAALAGALAACGDAAEEADDTATAEAAAAAEETMAGTYEFDVDGKTTTAVLTPEGTYTDSVDGEVVESGTWMDMDGKTCFNPEGDDTPETCFTVGETGPDGTFVATGEDGTVLTIKKVA